MTRAVTASLAADDNHHLMPPLPPPASPLPAPCQPVLPTRPRAGTAQDDCLSGNRLKTQGESVIAVLTATVRCVYSTAIRFGVPKRYVFAFCPKQAE